MPRQSSPQKPLYSPNPPSAQPRPSYSTPTPPVQQDRRAFGVQNALGQSPTMNGSIPHTPQPQYTPQSTGLTGYNTYMSEEQRSNQLRKNRQGVPHKQQWDLHRRRRLVEVTHLLLGCRVFQGQFEELMGDWILCPIARTLKSGFYQDHMLYWRLSDSLGGHVR
jgi:hypothetical protein